MGVVGMAAGVVADSRTDLGGQGVEALQKLFQGFLLEVRVGSEGLVEVVDVSGVMLAVVEGHGLGVDVGLKGIWCVGERGESEGARGRRRCLRARGGRQELRSQSGGEEELEEEALSHNSIFDALSNREKLFVNVNEKVNERVSILKKRKAEKLCDLSVSAAKKVLPQRRRGR